MHRPGRSPGQRFRFEQFLPLLEARGWEYDVSFVVSEKDDAVLAQPGHYLEKLGILGRAILTRASNLADRDRYDVIYIYREALMVNTAAFERLFSALGCRTVVDFDDAIWIPAVTGSHPMLAKIRGGGKFGRILRSASAVVAGNEYLAGYARKHNGNVHVIPTVLDTDKYYPRSKSNSDLVTIGWSGSPSTLQYLHELTPALAEVQRMFPNRVRIKVYGDGDYVNPQLGIQGLRWSEASELDEVASMDIGLMPQPDDAWTRGKCGFKALLYMSMGIPAIVSPVGVNRDIVADGQNGLWATRHEDWVAAMRKLVTDPELRTRLGEAGRATVCSRYSVASQADKYVEILQQLL